MIVKGVLEVGGVSPRAQRCPGRSVKSTWEHRDLPVLAAVIRLLDETATAQVRVSKVAEACGLSIDEVASCTAPKLIAQLLTWDFIRSATPPGSTR